MPQTSVHPRQRSAGLMNLMLCRPDLKCCTRIRLNLEHRTHSGSQSERVWKAINCDLWELRSPCFSSCWGLQQRQRLTRECNYVKYELKEDMKKNSTKEWACTKCTNRYQKYEVCSMCIFQETTSVSHSSKKCRLNKPLSIWTPPLLQKRSQQARADHQCNRLSTLL